MTTFGYIRKNYPYDTTNQIRALMSHNCEDIFIENENLKVYDEQRLLLDSLKKGDTLIVVSLLSFGKRSNELQEIIDMLDLKKVQFISLDEQIDTTNLYKFNDILKIIGTIDKRISGDKIKSKLIQLKNSGEQLGRPAISQETIDRIRELRFKEQLTLTKIAQKCDISVGTVYKYIQ